MKRNLQLFSALAIFGFTLSAPTASDLVISSTEPSKENEEKETASSSPLHPIIYEMDIKSNISNRFAKTLVISKVKNAKKSAQETTFTVVLPENAFISEFVMEIGGKSYKAYVKEKEDAKNVYDKARASGQSAAHVSVSARNSNKFTVSVNIEPEAKAVFLLTYEELLQRKNEQYELVLNINPGQIVKNLNIQVQVNESRPLKFVRTPSLRSGNEISKNEENLDPSSDIEIINATSAVVKFSPDSKKQKEFAQHLNTKESDGLSGQFVVQYDVERDSHGGEVLLQDGYFVHFFAPSDLEPLQKHVVFVLDTSGSMDDQKITQMKDAMNSILDEIKKEDLVHIIEFSSDVKVWDILSENNVTLNETTPEKLSNISLPAPILADKDNISKAKNVIKKIDAFGITYLSGGLETALYLVKKQQESISNDTDKQHQPMIILLTDGEPNTGITSTEEIVKIVTRLNSENNNVPIFLLSFGYGADKAFLRKLSLNNNGFSRHIYEASDASIQLQEFYKQISSPLLSNIKFKYESEVNDVTKAHFPIYFDGSELVIAGKYEDSSFPSVIDGWGLKGPISLRPTIEKPISSLERLWAYLTVKQTLEDRGSVDDKTELTQKAFDLAVKYSFVTDVTSLVVVKPNDTSTVGTEKAVEGDNSYIINSGFAVPSHLNLKSTSYSNTAPEIEVAYFSPCQPSPCGPNSKCREIDSHPVCSCLPHYIGLPPGCTPEYNASRESPQHIPSPTYKPECIINADCTINLSCINQKCKDPCIDTCGSFARCSVRNHRPFCYCFEGYIGDPFVRCLPLNSTAPEVEADLCNPSPCGPNSQCNKGVCTCLAEYEGDPYIGCAHKCVVHTDCLTYQSCIRNKCSDPCPGTCGLNAECSTVNHVPVCTCIPGYTGNVFVLCRPIPSPDSLPPSCKYSPCGPNSICREVEGDAICNCKPGYIGRSPTCRPECVTSSECARDKFCINQKCLDPCPGVCGINASCQVVNHNPVCSCREKYYGDPFTICYPEPLETACQPSPCGSNSECHEINSQAVCSCLPNYIGTPPHCKSQYNTNTESPQNSSLNCKPKCTVNADCSSNLACINEKCRYPCSDTCGISARCSVINHRPICNCFEGYTGDPYVRCLPLNSTAEHEDTSVNTTTVYPVTTIKPHLESTLPWLASIISPNGTITIFQKIYELGDNFSSTIECTKTPDNSTETGICTLLKDCSEVHPALTDFQVYQQYFCPINNRFAGVCCPTKTSN